MTRAWTVAAFVAGMVAAATGTAFATGTISSIVGPDNKIHGCYLTSAGLLRVVEAGTACRDGESGIEWTATGSGATGPAGPAGPKGDPGARWRGTWTASGTYQAGDLVRHNGSVWVHRTGFFTCLVGQDCKTPGPSPFWERFTQDGAAGAPGPAGPAGPQGPPGPANTYALSTVTIFGPFKRVGGVSIGGQGFPFDVTVDADCPAGYAVTGGGHQLNLVAGFSYPVVVSSHAEGHISWKARVIGSISQAANVQAWATCARLN